jgi:3-oxoacyl-[acyl-carrier protein] reductase
MDLKLKDKQALITGSTSGIGAEIARMLAAEGAQIVVHGRNRDRAQAVVADIEAKGGQAAFVLGDVSTAEGAATIADAARHAFGGIDILINNAGGSSAGGRSVASGWLDTPAEEWIDTKLGVRTIVQAVARLTAFKSIKR